jgi:putative flippase GtrA
MRFGLVGGINTLLDLLIFNSLLWLFPTSNLFISLGFNSLAYSVGAVNSFLLNKYWTFQHRQSITGREVSRFVITTLLGIGCNDLLLWCANLLFVSLIARSLLWVNASKIMAIAGTVLISYLGMRLWVFTNRQEFRTKAPDK